MLIVNVNDNTFSFDVKIFSCSVSIVLGELCSKKKPDLKNIDEINLKYQIILKKKQNKKS